MSKKKKNPKGFFLSEKFITVNFLYRNDPKFLDRYAWANSADPDQTAPSLIRVYTVLAIRSASFGHITLW